MKNLELRAINNPKTQLRHVLNKGLHKHHAWEFRMPRDYAGELREKKRIERETRINNFSKMMDTVDF